MPQQFFNMNLYEFQKEAIQKTLSYGSQIIALPTGTGKTIVAITVIEKLLEKYGSQFRCLVIVPANLRSNFTDNILKFHLNLSNSIITSIKDFHDTYEKSNVLVISYNFLRLYINEICKYKYDLVICDEIHYAKNRGSATFKSLFTLRKNVKHFVGLTASPISNNAQEFFTIVALVANDLSIIRRGMKLVKFVKMGGRRKKVKNKSWWMFGAWKVVGSHQVQIGIKDPVQFRDLVSKWIYIPSMQKIVSVGKRPKVTSKIIKVPLTKYETRIYNYVLGNISPFILRQLEKGTISDNDIRKIKNWLISAQQVLLSPDYILEDREHIINPTPSSKVKAVGKLLLKSQEKSIVYTPFLNFGAKVANTYFNSIGVKSKEYSGSIPKDERKKVVDEFENGNLQVICLTGAGQEGINLPSCKNVFFLSLHFNPEVMRQVMGRALRITSKNEFVRVYFVFAIIKTFPFMGYKETIDQWISRIVNRKSLLRQEIFRILQENQEL